MNREYIQEEFRKQTEQPIITLNKCEVGTNQEYVIWLEKRVLAFRKHDVSNCYTIQNMIDAYDAGVYNPHGETAKEYMKRKHNV